MVLIEFNQMIRPHYDTTTNPPLTGRKWHIQNPQRVNSCKENTRSYTASSILSIEQSKYNYLG